jgi:multimeric flavodoxin WrbA
MKTIIISGSARFNGDTSNLVKQIQKIKGWQEVLLLDYDIGHFDYDHKNKGDDFLPLINRLISEYDTFVFVTPVYWYSMSGRTKVFFDRLTDLLTTEKVLGQKLKGKNLVGISISIGNNLGLDFWKPFENTSNYLSMNYLGGLHLISNSNFKGDLEIFLKAID